MFPVAGYGSTTPAPGLEELLSPGRGGAACGGTLVQPAGRIIASTRSACGSSGLGGGGSLAWRIQVPAGRVVRLRFLVFNIDPDNRDTRVKVSVQIRSSFV